MEMIMVLNEQDWNELRPATADKKSPEKLARLINKLELAARREQELVKRKLRRRIEIYRRLRDRKGRVL
jgi:phage I-like protein